MGPTNQSYVLVCLSLVSLTYSDVVDFIVCPSDNLLFSVGERIMGLVTDEGSFPASHIRKGKNHERRYSPVDRIIISAIPKL